MSIYDETELEREIEALGGEVDESSIEALIVAQTNSLQSLERMLKYVSHLEYFQENAKQEIERIREKSERAKKIVDNIKKYITPYVESKGKLDVGTFTLSTRKSESVIVDNANDLPSQYKNVTISETPNKIKIKEDLKDGLYIQGARLEEKRSVQIK